MTPTAAIGKTGALEQTSAIQQPEWTLPDRGRVGVLCLIVTEFAIFTIFVVAYIFYIGKSLTGPTPSQVLELPIWATIFVIQQYHGCNRGARTESKPDPVIQTMDRRDHPAGPGIPAEHRC